MLALPAKAAMTYVSLFSGIGGFDLGFDRAGMHCAAQVEWDGKARAVLAHHWPHVKQYEDVRNVGKRNLPAVDLICGGFPCQDVSVAGRRAGLAGERSGLWFEFLRIITELTPRWVVIENVPGLLSSNSGRDFATVLQGLVECGYRVGWRVLDAQYFGLAQRRKRVFIVAGLAAAGANPAEVLFERESGCGDTPPSRTPGQGTTPYVIKGAAIGRQPENDPQYGEISEDGTVYTLNTSEVHAIAGTLPASGAGTSRTGNERSEASLLVPMVANAIDVRNSRSNGDVSGTLQSKKTGGYSLNYINPIAIGLSGEMNASKEIVGALDAGSRSGGGQPAMVAIHAASGEDISPPLTNLSKGVSEDGRGLHAFALGAYGVRRLTPTECERLQGFPDGHTAVNDHADSTRYKQLGNAVAVPVAEWLGKRIVAA